MLQVLIRGGLVILTAAVLSILPRQGATQTGAGEPGAEPLKLSATLTAQPASPQTEQPAMLSITLTDQYDQPAQDLLEHHARKIHVVIVSADMNAFGHVHPEDFGNLLTNGSADVVFAFPRPGRYLVAADAMTSAGPFAEYFPITVEGGPSFPETPSIASLAVVNVGADDVYTAPIEFDAPGSAEGYAVSVSRPRTLKAGEPATFTWRLTKNGRPITDLRLFLAAAMHLAVVKDDLSRFLHGHGVAKGLGTGYDHVHGARAAKDSGDVPPDIAYFGPEIVATVTFPEAGRYHLFGQSAHGEKMLVTRVPVEVR